MGKNREFKWDQKKLTYNLTYKDVVDILQSINASSCRELHLELGDLKLRVVKRGSLGPAPIAKRSKSDAEAHSVTAKSESNING
jgi:hypothetical protein